VRGRWGEKKWTAVFLTLFFVNSGCQRDMHTVQENRILMDTLVSINVYTANFAEEPKLRRAIASAFEEMARFDSLFSAYREDSEVSKINRNVSKKLITISEDMYNVLRVARWASEISEGAFDVTIGPVLRLWGFGTDSMDLPPPEKIAARLPLVNYKNIVMNRPYHSGEKFRILFGILQSPENVSLDLGGVAKGYIVDRGIDVLQQNGIRDAMITAGGDLRALTSPLTAASRYIWIRHPRDSAANPFFSRFKLEGEAAVSTSGDYERCFFKAGKRYHHIIDPHTGYPAAAAVSATVVAKNSVQADALSTAIFVLGPQRGIALADSLPEVEAMIIYQDGEKLSWRATPALQKKFELFYSEKASAR